MKFKALLAGCLLVGSTTLALAAGPYAGIAGGVSITHDSDIGASGFPTHEAEYDNGYAINASVGYNFEPVRAEFEFGYKKADFDDLSGPILNGEFIDSDLTVMSYMLNCYYDFATGSPLTPYIGAGIGLLDGEADFNGSSLDDTVFGYQLAIGAAYAFNRNVALELSYRYMGAASDFEDAGGDLSYESSNIMAGLRFNF
jgi:opacity protein-like surface antigen